MKLLDRYIILTFLKNYLLSFFVLVGLYIVLHMVFKFDDIVSVQGRSNEQGFRSVLSLIYELGNFYFYQGLLFFVQLAGIIPGVAASFTLLRMTRNNELIAIMAAGVPLLRVAAPIIIMAAALSGLVVIDQEFIIPNVIPKLTTRLDTLNSNDFFFSIPAMQDDKNALLVATRYYPPTFDTPAHMEVVDIIERDAGMQPLGHIYADRAQWDETQQQWKLINGYRVADVVAKELKQTARVPQAFYQSNINPEEVAIFRSGNFVDLLSIRRINQLLAPSRRNSYGARDLLRAKHTRVTQWLMNIVMLLLSIPAVLIREPGGLRLASIKCLALTGLCLGFIALTNNLAGQPPPGPRWTDTWPAIMAWMPLFIFGPLSVYLLDRVKT